MSGTAQLPVQVTVTAGLPAAPQPLFTTGFVGVNGHLMLVRPDGSMADAGLVTGRGIVNAALDQSGNLILSYTDGTSGNIGGIGGLSLQGGQMAGAIKLAPGAIGLYESVDESVAATGSSIGTAYQLGRQVNIITSVAQTQGQPNGGVQLYALPDGGLVMEISNITTLDALIYPSQATQIATYGIGIPVLLGPGLTVRARFSPRNATWIIR